MILKMSQDTQNQPAGVLLVDKPQGITSPMLLIGYAGSFE